MLHQLKSKQVEAAKPGTTLNDGGGLFLRVGPGGAARWVYRFKLRAQRQREMGLGSAGPGGLSLKGARDKAAAARTLVQQGLDPIEQGEAAAVERAKITTGATFGAYVAEFLPGKLAGYRNAKHRYQWEHSLTVLAAPLAKMKLRNITRAEILTLLRPLWDEKHVTAQRFRGRLENLFDHAIQNGAYHGDNPARWELFNATLSAPRKMEGRGPLTALARADIPDFIQGLRAAQARSTAALALEFCILGATRSGEVRLARWREFDLGARLWHIPGERMKVKARAGRPYVHTVILTPRMVEILHQMKEVTGGTPDLLVFPGNRRHGAQSEIQEPLSDMSMRAVLRRMGLGATVHGFRSTFRDWAGSDTEFPRELAEEALSHTLPDVERAYRREQAVTKRRHLMEAWEAFCEGRSEIARGNILSLHGK